MKRVLIDRHHAGLFYSLQLLGDRLDWQVYTPVGNDWWTEDYWTFGREAYGDDRLRRQYLDIDAEWRDIEGFLYATRDPEYPWRDIRGVTLEVARFSSWDYVMATVPDNQRGFKRFADEVGATFLYQVGNTRQFIDWSLNPLVIASSEVPLLGRGVRYHQEMHPAYDWREPTRTNSIKSFVNFASKMECWPLTVQLWQALGSSVSWKLHGGGMPDGVVQPTTTLADAMADAGWGLHDKVTGDGFGHVLWGWAAIGRPLIGHASHYAGQLGDVLWSDLETCIDLDQHPPDEAAALIREIDDDPDRHLGMCRAIHERFRAYYDPERDAHNIARLLGA